MSSCHGLCLFMSHGCTPPFSIIDSMTLQFSNRIRKQPSKADALIDLTEFGRPISYSSIDRIDSGKTTLLRQHQLSKVLIGMSGIGPWINISSRDPQ